MDNSEPLDVQIRIRIIWLKNHLRRWHLLNTEAGLLVILLLLSVVVAWQHYTP